MSRKLPSPRGLAGFAARLDRVLGRLCAALVAAMVAIVWLGVFGRYVVDLGVTWTEELARYVMIWAALLAVPVGVHRRAHIGVEVLAGRLPPGLRRPLARALDLVGIGFFLFLGVFGLAMVRDGLHQYATIFGMTMAVPFASVPVCAFLSAFQLVAGLLDDRHRNLSHVPGYAP